MTIQKTKACVNIKQKQTIKKFINYLKLFYNLLKSVICKEYHIREYFSREKASQFLIIISFIKQVNFVKEGDV